MFLSLWDKHNFKRPTGFRIGKTADLNQINKPSPNPTEISKSCLGSCLWIWAYTIIVINHWVLGDLLHSSIDYNSCPIQIGRFREKKADWGSLKSLVWSNGGLTRVIREEINGRRHSETWRRNNWKDMVIGWTSEWGRERRKVSPGFLLTPMEEWWDHSMRHRLQDEEEGHRFCSAHVESILWIYSQAGESLTSAYSSIQWVLLPTSWEHNRKMHAKGFWKACPASELWKLLKLKHTFIFMLTDAKITIKFYFWNCVTEFVASHTFFFIFPREGRANDSEKQHNNIYIFKDLSIRSRIQRRNIPSMMGRGNKLFSPEP